MFRIISSLVPALGWSSLTAASMPEPALDTDVVYHNATIITMDDDSFSVIAASIKKEENVANGTLTELKPQIGSDTKVYVLGGRTVHDKQELLVKELSTQNCTI